LANELTQKSVLMVDPGQAALLDKIYSQILSRSFVNAKGAVIMLSIAYGANQNDSLALHYPEVCYPAQGFEVLSKKSGVLETSRGTLRVKRLITRLGGRSEPVTYWTMEGEHAVLGGLETKFAQLSYGLRGQIPDGMLVRVSSIDPQPENAFELQAKFIAEMVAAIPEKSLSRFTGIVATQHPESNPVR
jgi:EpsI family protein